jgi:hypothetical protein
MKIGFLLKCENARRFCVWTSDSLSEVVNFFFKTKRPPNDARWTRTVSCTPGPGCRDQEARSSKFVEPLNIKPVTPAEGAECHRPGPGRRAAPGHRSAAQPRPGPAAARPVSRQAVPGSVPVLARRRRGSCSGSELDCTCRLGQSFDGRSGSAAPGTEPEGAVTGVRVGP